MKTAKDGSLLIWFSRSPALRSRRSIQTSCETLEISPQIEEEACGRRHRISADISKYG